MRFPNILSVHLYGEKASHFVLKDPPLSGLKAWKKKQHKNTVKHLLFTVSTSKMVRERTILFSKDSSFHRDQQTP